MKQTQQQITQLQNENQVMRQEFQQKLEDYQEELRLFQEILIPQELIQPEKQDMRNQRSSSLNRQRLFKGETCENKYIQCKQYL